MKTISKIKIIKSNINGMERIKMYNTLNSEHPKQNNRFWVTFVLKRKKFC